MRVVGRIILLAVVLVGALVFWRHWRQTTPWGYGTGYYAGKSGETNTAGAPSRLEQVAKNPKNYVGKKVTLTGRVRQPGKYASNRNIYTLVTSDSKTGVLVIDDKAPPQDYYTRTVTGVIQRVPGTDKLYLVDVKSGVKINTPTLADVKKFFVTGYQEASHVTNNIVSDIKK